MHLVPKSIVAFSLLVNFASAGGVGIDCPCVISVVDELADCDDAPIKSIPECIPSTIHSLIITNTLIVELTEKEFQRLSNLEYLDVSFNPRLRYLLHRCFVGLSDLQSLKLNFNKFHTLNESSFTGLVKLRDLEIYGSGIEYSEAHAFKGLSNLRSLILDQNKLKNLNHNSFSGLTALEVLSLNYNPIDFGNPLNIFTPLKNLRTLWLKGICKFYATCRYRDKEISKTTTLKTLYIDGLQKVPVGSELRSLKSLEKLFLGTERFCTIDVISANTFKSLTLSPLTQLDMKNCNMRGVLPATFETLKNLTTLNFEHNSVCLDGLRNVTIGMNATHIRHLKVTGLCLYSTPVQLEKTHLEGLTDTSLETLDLSECSIKAMRKDVYSVLPKTLKYIYLQKNYINHIDLDQLHLLPNLNKLYINDQKLYGYSSGESGGKLKLIQIHPETSNKDERQRVPSFQRAKNANDTHKHSSYAHNQTALSEDVLIPASESVDPPYDCILIPHHLNSIDISNGYLLYYILRMWCDPNNSLKKVFISKQLDRDFFRLMWERLRNLVKLNVLNLDDNNIRFIPREALRPLKNLQLLSLSGNALVTLDFDVGALVNLDLLALWNNKIQYVSEKFTNGLEAVGKNTKLSIIMGNNVLFCDCDRLNFVAWLRNTKLLEGKEGLTCKYRNGSLLSLSRISVVHELLKSECIAASVLISCGVGFAILLLVLSLVAVIYSKRRNFRYLKAIARRNINPYHPIEDCNIELSYDVYISYDRDFNVTQNETMHEFVTHKLYPFLQRRGFKVLIRDEFDAGRWLYDVIGKALRRCRKVIILLSKDYCKDYWNVYEFNTAIMEGIYTKRQVVLAVMMELLTPADLPEELSAYMSSATVPLYTAKAGERLLLEYLCEGIR